MKPFTTVLSILALISLCQANQVHVAVLVLSNHPLGEQVGTERLLPNSYAETNDITVSNPTWSYDLIVRGLASVGSAVSEQGGIPIGVSSRLFLNLTFINIGPPSLAANSTALEAASQDAIDWLRRHENSTTDNGKFVAWVPVTREPQVVALFSESCEFHQDCLVLVPLVVSESLFKCQGSPDCQSRGRGVGSRRFHMTLGILPDDSYSLSDLYDLAKERHVQTAAVVASASEFGQAALGGSKAHLRTIRISLVAEHTIPSAALFTVDDALAIARDLKAKNPEVLALFAQPSEVAICKNLIDALKIVDWFPKALGNGGSCTGNAFPTGGDSAFVFYQVPWHHDVQGADYHTPSTDTNFEPFPSNEVEDSPQVYSKFISDRHQVSEAFQVISILGTAVGATLVRALATAGKDQPSAQDLLEPIRLMNDPSVFGILAFDIHGRMRAGTRPIVQIANEKNEVHIVIPRSIGEGKTRKTMGMCVRVFAYS